MQTFTNHLSRFFAAWSLPEARTMLTKLLVAAGSASLYKGSSAAELLYFTEQLKQLLHAAATLLGQKQQLPAAIIPDTAAGRSLQLGEYRLYCGHQPGYSPWDYFPRQLSSKEFIDPHKALKKLYRYQSAEEWEATLQQLAQHSLSQHPAPLSQEGSHLLQVSRLLHKLVEACHLLYLRAVQPREAAG